MSIKVLVHGREAIPVRAIPFVTGRTIVPEEIAEFFAHNDDMERLKELATYHLSADGNCVQVLPKEWDAIGAALASLHVKLKEGEKISGSSRADWRRDSIELLPAGVFVWCDEFVKAFTRAYGPDSALAPLNVRFDGIEERSGDRELTFTPMMTAVEREMLFKGFPTNFVQHGTASATDQDVVTSGLLGGDDPTVPIAAPSETPKERRVRHDITAERGCRRLILENWDAIEKVRGSAPSPRYVLIELGKYISDNDSKPTLKTVQNRLNDLRKEKLIP